MTGFDPNADPYWNNNPYGQNNPYGGSDPYAAQNYGAPAVPQRPRPSTILKVIAYVSIAFGLLMILAAIAKGDLTFFMTGLLVSTPFILIPGWWFFCLWQDDKRWNTYEEAVQSQQSVSQYLTDTDRDLLRGMGTIDPPEQFKRRWPIVILIAGALFFCSAFFQYKDDENIEGESSDPASLSGNVGEDPAHGRKQVSPGNSGSGDTYYPDCEAVWDELGRPIRSGEPGYDTHLDRDNDGVGCEVQPE